MLIRFVTKLCLNDLKLRSYDNVHLIFLDISSQN